MIVLRVPAWADESDSFFHCAMMGIGAMTRVVGLCVPRGARSVWTRESISIVLPRPISTPSQLCGKDGGFTVGEDAAFLEGFDGGKAEGHFARVGVGVKHVCLLIFLGFFI